MEAPEVEFVADLQRGQQILLHGGGVLVVLNFPDFLLHRLFSSTAKLRVKGFRPDGEEGGVEGQGLVDLVPGDAEGHHDVGHGMGLGEEIADFRQGIDVPLRYVVLPHGLLPAGLKAPFFHLPLSDGLHDLKAHLGVQPLGNQVEHNVVPAAHRLQNRCRLADDQLPGVAQPHVGAVGEAGEAHQGVEVLGLGVYKHLPGEAGVELRDGHRPGGAQDFVVLIAQDLAGNKDRHGVRVVQGDFLRVHPGEILHHADHGGVIVSQHIQL